ncbi:MAG TPA: sugar transferase [Planctomycetota bacterium]|nr:sugar transferase [Planctomycetota bacterium]
MIVILFNQLDRRSRSSDPVFGLTLELELLNQPYVDRLALEYRRMGASQVLRAEDGLPASLHGKMVVIADAHLWPGAQTRRAIRQFRRSHRALAAFVRPRTSGGYAEVIEQAGESTSCTVTRCYPEEFADVNCIAALLVRPALPGSQWQTLLAAIHEGNREQVISIAVGVEQKIHGRPFWINTAGQYLRLVERLLTEQGRPDPAARQIAENVWAMPGAEIKPDCLVEGPVLFGRNCRIGRGCSIIGPAIIGDGARVGERCFVGGSILQKAAVLPNRARAWKSVLRADAPVAEGQNVAYAWMTPAARWLPSTDSVEFDSVAARSARALVLHNPRLYAAAKRAVDVAGAIVGIGITLPLYPFIVLVIKLDDPGPAFFVHRRQTLGGREFGCLKFRTMRHGSHELQLKLPNEVDGPQFYIKNDPRVTRVGRFLRRTRLDETPQFWNVLLGQMSLVGPRPSPRRENQFCPAWREARLSVRAGLTGLWQTQGSPDRSAGGFHEWIHYDSQYVKECSLRTDLKVLWDTIRRIVK